MATTAASRVQKKPEIPSAYDWRTTDSEEILKRRMRAKEESFAISNTAPSQPVFSNFRVKSGSGLTYGVEVRSVQDRHFSCDCVDFRINGLGTCKHVEAVLLQLEARHKRLFKSAASAASPRIDLVVDPSALTLRVPNRLNELPH